MKNDHRLTETTNPAFFLKPVWQDLWRNRVRIVLLYSTSLALLLWSKPSGRSYDVLYTVLIMISTILPLINLIRALLLSRTTVSDDALLKAGMLRIDLLDDRNVIPIAVLTITIASGNAALLQLPALRTALQAPSPLAPGRWFAVISTALVVAMLFHMSSVLVICYLEHTGGLGKS